MFTLVYSKDVSTHFYRIYSQDDERINQHLKRNYFLPLDLHYRNIIYWSCLLMALANLPFQLETQELLIFSDHLVLWTPMYEFQSCSFSPHPKAVVPMQLPHLSNYKMRNFMEKRKQWSRGNHTFSSRVLILDEWCWRKRKRQHS